MPSLKDKLRMIDAPTAQRPAAPTPPPAQSCYHTLETFALTSFCELRHMSAALLGEIFGQPFPVGLRPQDVLFLDTETTGLSGGAGTIAFEVGLGYVAGDGFVVEQFLMRDYPEEPLLLQAVGAFAARFPALVTFNGRTFDVPLLQSRFQMNRINPACLNAPHGDMLHAARRVWKLRLGRCTLQRLEQAVLGVSREDDLPGEQVPQTYFRFLRDGDFAPLERILTHNRQDIVSLAQLFFFLCKLHAHPETATDPLDLLSLGRLSQRRGNSAKAKACYRLGARGVARATAFGALAAQEKREGHAQRAARLYTAMLARGDHPVDACEALAKLHEHQLNNLEQALAYTRQALWLLSEPTLVGGEAVQAQRNALQYRYARLRRKLAGDANA